MDAGPRLGMGMGEMTLGFPPRWVLHPGLSLGEDVDGRGRGQGPIRDRGRARAVGRLRMETCPRCTGRCTGIGRVWGTARVLGMGMDMDMDTDTDMGLCIRKVCRLFGRMRCPSPVRV